MEYNEEIAPITTVEGLKSLLYSGVNIILKCKDGYTIESNSFILYENEIYTDAPECSIYALDSISYYEPMFNFENIKVDIT